MNQYLPSFYLKKVFLEVDTKAEADNFGKQNGQCKTRISLFCNATFWCLVRAHLCSFVAFAPAFATKLSICCFLMNRRISAPLDAAAAPAPSAGLVLIALVPSPVPFSSRSLSATELAAAPLVTISFVSPFSAATGPDPAAVPEEEDDFFFFFLFLLVLPPASFWSLELLPAATDVTVAEVKEDVVSEASVAAVGGAPSVLTAELPPEEAPPGEVGSTAERFPFVFIVIDPLPSPSLVVNEVPLASIVTGIFMPSVRRSRATFTCASAVVKCATHEALVIVLEGLFASGVEIGNWRILIGQWLLYDPCVRDGPEN